MPQTEREKTEYRIRYAKENLKRVPFDCQKDYYEEVLKPAAEKAGMKVNAFIKAAIAEKIERENLN
jgi:hypothetical protein